jgi:hypothetical protein
VVLQVSLGLVDPLETTATSQDSSTTRGRTTSTFGFALNKFDNSAANATTVQSAGSLSVRENNPDSFAGEIHWQPLAQTANVPGNMPSDWAIKFDSYKISFGNQSTTNSGGVAIIEPYFQELRIPNDEAVNFCSSNLVEFDRIVTRFSQLTISLTRR